MISKTPFLLTAAPTSKLHVATTASKRKCSADHDSAATTPSWKFSSHSSANRASKNTHLIPFTQSSHSHHSVNGIGPIHNAGVEGNQSR